MAPFPLILRGLTPAQYNFVTSAAFSAAIAISCMVTFFSLQLWDINMPDWIGNDILGEGCDGTPMAPECRRLLLKDGEYFGPRLGEFH